MLIADLMGTAKRVANMTGTYSCFPSGRQQQLLSGTELVASATPRTGLTARMPAAVSFIRADRLSGANR